MSATRSIAVVVAALLSAMTACDRAPPAPVAKGTTSAHAPQRLDIGSAGDAPRLAYHRIKGESGEVQLAIFREPPTVDGPEPRGVARWVKRHQPLTVFRSIPPYDSWELISQAGWIADGDEYFGVGLTSGVGVPGIKDADVIKMMTPYISISTQLQLLRKDWSPDGRWCCSLFLSGGKTAGGGGVLLGDGAVRSGGNMHILLTDAQCLTTEKVWMLTAPTESHAFAVGGWSEDSRFYAVTADRKGPAVAWVLTVPALNDENTKPEKDK